MVSQSGQLAFGRPQPAFPLRGRTPTGPQRVDGPSGLVPPDNLLITDPGDDFLHTDLLTTSPYAQGVPWSVCVQAIVASPHQIRQFQQPLGFDTGGPIRLHGSGLGFD